MASLAEHPHPSNPTGHPRAAGLGLPVGAGSRGGAGAPVVRLIERAREILGNRYSEPFDLPRLAAELRVSPCHLCRCFKRVTGTTPSRYVHGLRIDEALRRLGSSRGRLADLALDLGFASHSHFTMVFRREVGDTPSEVQRSLPR